MICHIYWFIFMAHIIRTPYFLALIFSCLTFFTINTASASVTLLGNRVIYPAEAREKTLQFTNDDDVPALIQIWLDTNNPKSTPENADAPFIVSPQIFRMNPHSGQMVRLMYVGKALPTDRESLFYLNFLQVPAVKQTDSEKNKLMLLLTNRLKVFYRPEGLDGDANHVIEQLHIQYAGKSLHISNPTPYYANVSHAVIINGKKRTSIEQADMLPPYSRVSWPLNEELAAGALKATLSVINDYGVEIPRTLSVTR